MNIKVATLALVLGLFGCGSDGKTEGSVNVYPNPDVVVIDNSVAVRAEIQTWADANPGKLVLPAGETIQTMEIGALSRLYGAAFLEANPDVKADMDKAIELKY